MRRHPSLLSPPQKPTLLALLAQQNVPDMLKVPCLP